MSTTTETTTKARFCGPDVVEDLQLPPALCISADTTLARALELGSMREYDMLPVLDNSKKPLGYVDIRTLRDASGADLNAPVPQKMTHFRRDEAYKIITPQTPLPELEDFFEKNTYCFVTDHARRFVLAVATREDLQRYVNRRYTGK